MLNKINQLLDKKSFKFMLVTGAILIILLLYKFSPDINILGIDTSPATFVEKANLPSYTEGTPVVFNIQWKSNAQPEAIFTFTSGKQEYKVGYADNKCSTYLPAGHYTITNVESENINFIYDIVGLTFDVSDSNEKQIVKFIINPTYSFNFIRFLKDNIVFVIVLIIYLVLSFQTNKNKIIDKLNSLKNSAKEKIGDLGIQNSE